MYNNDLNMLQKWLWEVVMLLLEVLSRDCFGDYISDQVVAPVRETAAQAIGMKPRLLYRSLFPVLEQKLTFEPFLDFTD